MICWQVVFYVEGLRCLIDILNTTDTHLCLVFDSSTQPGKVPILRGCTQQQTRSCFHNIYTCDKQVAQDKIGDGNKGDQC